MDADGSNIRSLVEGPFFSNDGSNDGLTFYFESAWSPDGNKIAIVACPYAWDNCYPTSTIVVVNSDGTGLHEIAPAGGFGRPTWSPDGRAIAFGSTTCRSCPSSIRFVLADGSGGGLIIADGHSPAWRPR
jgi:dipeptidyl aminopeptidase/acylaminoacyl peptidase